MDREFFVMLMNPKGNCFVPLLDEYDDNLLMFEDERDAKAAAEQTVFGRNHGYEVFCAGCGEASR